MGRGLTRRSFLARTAALLAADTGARSANRSAAEVGVTPPPPPPLPPPRRTAPILIGYGLVNHWHRIDAAWLSILLATHGLTLTALEYVPWFDDSGGGDTSISTDIGRARLFVDEMRSNGIVTLISVVNWNGAAQRGAPTPWFHDRIDEITHRIGPDRVLLLPINEPDRSAKALEWQDYARGVWPGILVFNGPGGRGDPLLRGAHYVSWNWCQDFTTQSIRTTTARLPTINTTDCTPVLNPGPARARAMARASLTHAAHFLVYDALGPSIDKRVVAAIGDEVQHATARPQDE